MARRPPAFVAAPLAAAVAGIALVTSVAGGTLCASTYARDVRAICEAEARSGIHLDRDMARVTQWILGHVTTPQGGELFAALRDEPLRERAKDLRAQAQALLPGSCPLAQSYEALWAEGEYRADLQHVCSRFTFPAILDLSPAIRVQRLAEWLETDATTTQARALATPLRLERTAHGSSVLLRQASNEAGVLSCDAAGMLETEALLVCPSR